MDVLNVLEFLLSCLTPCYRARLLRTGWEMLLILRPLINGPCLKHHAANKEKISEKMFGRATKGQQCCLKDFRKTFFYSSGI